MMKFKVKKKTELYQTETWKELDLDLQTDNHTTKFITYIKN